MARLPRTTAKCTKDTRPSGPLHWFGGSPGNVRGQWSRKARPGKSAMRRRTRGSAPYATNVRTISGLPRTTASANGVHSVPSPRRSTTFTTPRPPIRNTSLTSGSQPPKIANMSGVQRCREVVALTDCPRFNKKLTACKCPPRAATWIGSKPLSSHCTPTRAKSGSMPATFGPLARARRTNSLTFAEPTKNSPVRALSCAPALSKQAAALTQPRAHTVCRGVHSE
mmetsp:Transcript_102676/g.314053  ORF Transcript_102676/g.314053 Transcript_102676/m.314053 type:complete len:225 (+) Transcript_102676:883-1557(+)